MFLMIFLSGILALIILMMIVNDLGKNRVSQIKKRYQKILNQHGQEKTAFKKQTDKNLLAALWHKYTGLFKVLGIEVSLREIVTLNTVVYLLVFLVTFLFNKNIVASLLVACFGLFLPYVVLLTMVNRRFLLFDKLFGDALALMANTLRSGFSFRQALQIIARDMPSPIAEEFDILNQELNWGLSLEEALNNFYKRVPNEHVRLFITSVIIQNESGGSLSNILGKISETINSRQRLQNELNSLTAQGKASGLIVGLLPLAVGLVVSVVNPGYLTPLFTEPLGKMILAGAVFSELFGALIIKSLIKLD